MRTHLDLCAGIGGFSLAAHWAGYTTVGVCEIDPWCRRVLAKNFPGVAQHDDVFTLRGDEFGPIDLLTAGIPCQPYSVAGKRRGGADDRALWPTVLAVITVARPDRVLVENVGGFIDMALDGVLADLEGIGYDVGAIAVPACAVEARHIRNRVWILADADRERELQPQGSITDKRRRSRNSDPTPVSDALGVGSQRAGTTRERGVGLAHDGGRDLRAKSVIGGVDAGPDGVPAGLVRHRYGPPDVVRASWSDGSWDHDLPPVVMGEPERDRGRKIAAAGNAIVPQVAYEILRAWDL